MDLGSQIRILHPCKNIYLTASVHNILIFTYQKLFSAVQVSAQQQFHIKVTALVNYTVKNVYMEFNKPV